MKKGSRTQPDDLRPEYDLASLGPGVRGKYAGRLKGTTLVALQPEDAEAFPTSEAVNEALRAVLREANAGGTIATVIALVRQPIDLVALQAVTPSDGALCLFVGVVRDHNGGRKVLRLEYEAYEEMALPLMEKIAAEARQRWAVTDVRIVHRLGRLEVGEPSVAVAVAAAHRGEAFAACRYAIDTLKATVPIWKKEFYADGAVWLEEPGAEPITLS